MKISEEVLGCLGAVFLLILSVLGQGAIIWCCINVICFIFKINYHLNYFPEAILLGVVYSVLTIPFRKSDK